MRRFGLLLLGILVGGGLVTGAFHYHLVRTDNEWLIVPKRQARLAEAYVDVRHWTPNEWRRHPELIQALIAHGRPDVLVAPASREFLRGLQRKVGSALDKAAETARE